MKATMRSQRRGFVLLVMLWVLVSAGALASVVTVMGRDGFYTARNRVTRERALWRAEDCLARARAKADELLLGVVGFPASGASLWRVLDTAVANAIPSPRDCHLTLEAAGARVDVNGDEIPLRRVLSQFVGSAQSLALVDALADWRDADSVPRPLGAEFDWYALQGSYLPRNDSIADVRELARIRGFASLSGLEHVLGVEPGRISIANAPTAVLAAVPGFTAEAVALINTWRARGWQITDVMALTSSLTQASTDSLRAHYPEIARLTVLEPDAWILTSVGVAGAPPESVTVEVRVIRTERRAVIVRRRTWP